MTDYKVIGIDLAKIKFHLVAFNEQSEIALTKALKRNDFFTVFLPRLKAPQTFAFEACAGSSYMAQELTEQGHRCILLKPRDVKPYARSRQKNDINDAIAICKAALDPELMHVRPKTRAQQEVAYLHKARQNTIQQRIQRSNALMSSLFEFGYLVVAGKTKFARQAMFYVQEALEQNRITQPVYQEMIRDCREIDQLFEREKVLDQAIVQSNKESPEAQVLMRIPGIGPINASILSNKPMEIYETAKDFAASLGLVPKQNTTGGTISLGSISKQGDRYARTMLIQAGRAIVMRSFKPKVPTDSLYQFVERLKQRGKRYNVICVAVANKLARIAYACVMHKTDYRTNK